MLLSVMGITLEEIEISAALPINPTIIRIMRVLRIARGTSRSPQTRTRIPAGSAPETRAETHLWLTSSVVLKRAHVKLFFTLCCCSVLKLLKMATGMRALLDTVVQALPQVNPLASFTHSRVGFLFVLFLCRVAVTSSRWVSHLYRSVLAWLVHTWVSVLFSLSAQSRVARLPLRPQRAGAAGPS